MSSEITGKLSLACREWDFSAAFFVCLQGENLQTGSSSFIFDQTDSASSFYKTIDCISGASSPEPSFVTLTEDADLQDVAIFTATSDFSGFFCSCFEEEPSFSALSFSEETAHFSISVGLSPRPEPSPREPKKRKAFMPALFRAQFPFQSGRIMRL